MGVPDMTERDGGRLGCSVTRPKVCICAVSDYMRHFGKDTYEIPAAVLDIPKLILCNDSPYTFRHVDAILKRELELGLIVNAIGQFDDASNGLVGQLEEVVVRTQRNRSVQRPESSPSGGICKEVYAAVWLCISLASASDGFQVVLTASKTSRLDRSRELRGIKQQMSFKPTSGVSKKSKQ